MTGEKDISFRTFIIVSFLLLLVAASVHIYSIVQTMPLRGFSALDFANSILYPENFIRDYPGGAGSVKNALLPWIYPILMNYGVPYIWIYDVMVFLEVATLSMGAISLMRTLFPSVSRLSQLLLISLLTLSWARVGNLANFGNPFFHGQFYGFADGFALFAAALLLQKKRLPATLMFIFSFMVHPIITAYNFVFAISCAFFVEISWREWRSLIGFSVLFGLFAMGWFHYLTAPVETPMTSAEFFRYSYLLNSHWFPQDISAMGYENMRYCTAFFSALLMGLASLIRIEKSHIPKRGIVIGVLSVSLLAVLGCLVAYYEISPTLVKACMQRASVVALTIVSIIFSHQIIQDVRRKQIPWLVLALYCLAYNYLSVYTWPVIATMIYVYLTLSAHCQNTQPFVLSKTFNLKQYLMNLRQLFSANIIKLSSYQNNNDASNSGLYQLLLIGFILMSGYQAYLIALKYNAIKLYLFEGIKLLIASIIITAFLVSILNARKNKIYNIFCFALPVTIFCVLQLLWIRNFIYLDPDVISKNHDYQQVQLWAKDNTPKDALFLVDPSYAYGFREYSVRSSVGTPNEWLKTAWLYSGDQNLLHEGLVRNSILSGGKIKIPKTHLQHRDEFISNLMDMSLRNYYESDGHVVQQLVKRYHIDFVVFEKSNANTYGGIPNWHQVYENTSYIVMRP